MSENQNSEKRYPKRLIEVDLPIKEISEHARREKSIRHGHISTLHIWWARRPLAACRAVICASLWPDPADELCPQKFREDMTEIMLDFAGKVRENKNLMTLSKKGWPHWNRLSRGAWRPDNPTCWFDMRFALLEFIADFANWDASTVPEFLETSQKLTQSAHEAMGGILGTKPLVVDPFAGGGAIPFESLRIGADCAASDINPIAVMLNRIILEYIPRYGKRLVSEVDKWGIWVKDQSRRQLSPYYPEETNGSQPIGYLWARTIKCEGPNCGVEVPIIKTAIITDREHNETAIAIEYRDRILHTSVVFGDDAKRLKEGTSKRSSVTCPLCGFTTERKNVASQAKTKGFGFHMLAVCLRDKSKKRIYRQPNEQDYIILQAADDALERWKQIKFADIPAIPHEELPYLRSIFNVNVYGIDEWQKLFYRRQLLSALTFTGIIRKTKEEMVKVIDDKEFLCAILDCLALSVSNSFQYQCNIATYLTEGVKSAFIQGQSLPMKMDFIEANPIMEELAGGYDYSLSQHLSGLDYCSSYNYGIGSSHQASATDKMLPDDSVSLIATDPPYYDVVPYSDCSDFFYVWLRRMLRGIGSLTSDEELTPKVDEIVQLAERNEKYRSRTKKWFEKKICDSLRVASDIISPEGGAIIVFAHKETTAWEALLQAILDSGWVITGSWPIDTEKETRLRANASAVLGSSIHLFCRPRKTQGNSQAKIGFWRDVQTALPKKINDWMPRLSKEGIVGADAIFACIGPALEIYSRYSIVEKSNGMKVELKEYLEEVWAAVSREALNMIFEGGDVTGFEEDARLTAMWLWTLSTGNGSDNGGGDVNVVAYSGYTLEYDAARKIAQGLGAHLEKLSSLVEIKGDQATLLPVSFRTHYLFGKEESQAPKKKTKTSQRELFPEIEELESDWGVKTAPPAGKTILDRVHQSMILFASGRSEAMNRFLVEDGAGKDTRFWSLAQALSALYPSDSEEK